MRRDARADRRCYRVRRLHAGSVQLMAELRTRRGTGSTTILDVANRAGVSPMTASRVMNQNPRVNAQLRERVLAAAAELHYKPNLAGRSLRSAACVRLGVLYSNPSPAYLNQLMIGVLEESSVQGTQVVVEKCAGLRSQRAATRRLIDAGVDGIILPPPLCDSRQTTSELAAAKIPVVAVASGSALPGASSVRIDDYHAGRAMTRHLLALGHRRIGFIAGDPRHTPTKLRMGAFLDTMQHAGIEVPEELLAPGLFTYRSGLNAARMLLQLDPRPSAIFCSNDDMAAAAVAIAHGIGLRVPEDITITGFDDTAVATTIWPALTTVHQPVTAMGHAAVRLMLEAIRRNRRGQGALDEHQVMKFSLVKRESSSAPRA